MGTQLPLHKKGVETPPQFLAHVHCGQTARWIKTALGMEVGFGPDHIVLDGDPAPLPKKGSRAPIFGPSLLLPNGCMDQDGETAEQFVDRLKKYLTKWREMASFDATYKGLHKILRDQFLQHAAMLALQALY